MVWAWALGSGMVSSAQSCLVTLLRLIAHYRPMLIVRLEIRTIAAQLLGKVAGMRPSADGVRRYEVPPNNSTLDSRQARMSRCERGTTQ